MNCVAGVVVFLLWVFAGKFGNFDTVLLNF